jgi:hypothetical protein
MKLPKSTAVAWTIAMASLSLWASSAPLGWAHALHLGDDPTATTPVDTTASSSSAIATTTTTTTTDSNTTPTTTDLDGGTLSQAAPCPPAAPSAALAPAPVAPSASAPTTPEASFRLCGADAQAARAIEQLVAGRSFSASAVSRGDGCVDLTVRATSALASGQASSTLNVSLGSGQRLSIHIVSEGGATRVSIGQG